MEESNHFYSVGIDIGTTTTQVVFSRIFLEKTGGFGSVPNIKIAKKDVVYKSKIHFTPLVSHDIVDAGRLKTIIADEYRKSAIETKDITTGAVIITGESARKENAREVAQKLADFAGDFVVCTAGPDYESILAGWGAGAGDMSRRLSGNIVNFDIGGGTTNAAVFQNGDVVDAFAADIGGRLVRVDSEGSIVYISEKIQFLIRALGLKSIQVGRKANLSELSRLTGRMAEMFLEFTRDRSLSDDARRLFIGHPDAGLPIDFVMFSGGVAEYIYREEEFHPDESIYKYGDIGPLLGAGIRRLLPKMAKKIVSPLEKIRATVVGAGSYSTGLSGSTIAVNETVLPMKNVPVIKVRDCADEKALSEKIAFYLQFYDQEQVAVAIGNLDCLDYSSIRKIAFEILKGLSSTPAPIVVIMENDCAKALGLLLMNSLSGQRQVVCLDKIHVDNGDFIDIGKPICGVVPVIVKTLVFNS